MEMISRFTDINGRYPKLAVALGMFDGLHIGHRRVLAKAVDLSRQFNGTSMVFTFRNHPWSVLRPDSCPPQIADFSCKQRLVEQMGIDVLLAVPFTAEFLTLSPNGFIEMLVRYVKPAHIVVGPNYFFGEQRAGTPQTLVDAGKKYGFSVHIPFAVEQDGLIVSSTLIRQLIMDGDVQKAAALLNRPFCIGGVVAHGEQRGRTLGFPTANLPIANELVSPKDGVYAVHIFDENGIQYNGVANVGSNPTFAGENRRIEVHILDFSRDIYGQKMTVAFLACLRGEVKFAGFEQLKEQIEQDIAKARDFF